MLRGKLRVLSYRVTTGLGGLTAVVAILLFTQLIIRTLSL